MNIGFDVDRKRQLDWITENYLGQPIGRLTYGRTFEATVDTRGRHTFRTNGKLANHSESILGFAQKSLQSTVEVPPQLVGTSSTGSNSINSTSLSVPISAIALTQVLSRCSEGVSAKGTRPKMSVHSV